MASNTGRLGKASFIKEVAWGAYLDPDKGMSLTKESLANKITTVEDPRLLAKVFIDDMIKVGEQIDGSVDVTMHPSECGHYLFFTLGKNATPTRAAAGKLIICYRGTDVYASVTNTAGVIVGKSGATQATATQRWTFDTSAAAYDTLAELQAAIDAVADWNAFSIGSGTLTSARIADFAESQIVGAGIYDLRYNGIYVTYTGADAYADFERSGANLIGSSGANLAGKIGRWTFDLTNASYDILTELVAAIEAEADWTCTLVGVSVSSALLGAVPVTTCKTVGAFMPATSAFEHHIYPAGATDSEPSLSICVDRTLGTGKAIGLAGCKVNSFGLNTASRSIITGSIAVSGKVESLNKTYPTISVPDDNPYVASSGKLLINGAEMDNVKNITLNINNNLAVDGIVGSNYITEQIRQGAKIEISGQMNLDVTVWEELYPKLTGNNPVEIILYLENVDSADSAAGIKYSILIRLASVKFTGFDTFLSGPERITTNFTGTACESPTYNHIEVYVVDTASAVY